MLGIGAHNVTAKINKKILQDYMLERIKSDYAHCTNTSVLRIISTANQMFKLAATRVGLQSHGGCQHAGCSYVQNLQFFKIFPQF